MSLTKKQISALGCPVKCPLLTNSIPTVAEYLQVLHASTTGSERFWFRGQASSTWDLVPSALRYRQRSKRIKALKLLVEFRRLAEIKLTRPPRDAESLKWMQLAQHYGVPTRLLDWTENALYALYFASQRSFGIKGELSGIVFIFAPRDLGYRQQKSTSSSVLNVDERLARKYITLGARQDPAGLGTVALYPVWNSERLMVQKGVFTLHGSKSFALDQSQAPSLVGLPIPAESKAQLRSELERLGIDEMTLFPELEHIGISLKRKEGLDEE